MVGTVAGAAKIPRCRCGSFAHSGPCPRKGKSWRYEVSSEQALSRLTLLLHGDVVLLDTDDVDRVVERGGWYVSPQGYVIRNIYRVGTTGPIGREHLHRFVVNATTDDPDVDHRNRNKLDNRKGNLRFTPPAGRSQNRTKSLGKTSRFMGVSWDRKAGKWRARAGQKFLGYFIDEEEAGRVAAEARARLHPYSTD